MKKLWGGRFKEATDQLTDEFNASIDFDRRLYKEDIKGSLAHAKMLEKSEILNEEEYEAIRSGLEGILRDYEDEKIDFSETYEDIHMNIEALLTERIGEAGKKLHTARSRNDQVATDFELYLVSACDEVIDHIKALIKTLLELAEENLDTILPGYTHLQRAQPITLAHYLNAYVQMFLRDIKRFKFIREEDLRECSLGSGALAGTTFDIDRFYTAELLDFKAPKANSIDGVSDRDYALDFLQACAVCMMHLSRFCEEIILYNSVEFGFIHLDDRYTTGSSIMPQKKNPDLAELIRGKTGRTYGNLISLLVTMKGLPLAYNKDMQEDKEPVFDSFDTLAKSLTIFERMIATAQFDKEKMLEACKLGFINATDLADYLAAKDLPFREAHEIVGRIVLFCEQNGRAIEDLSLEELNGFSSLFNKDVYDAISLKKMVDRRNVYGGPARETEENLIKELKKQLAKI